MTPVPFKFVFGDQGDKGSLGIPGRMVSYQIQTKLIRSKEGNDLTENGMLPFTGFWTPATFWFEVVWFWLLSHGCRLTGAGWIRTFVHISSHNCWVFAPLSRVQNNNYKNSIIWSSDTHDFPVSFLKGRQTDGSCHRASLIEGIKAIPEEIEHKQGFGVSLVNRL